MVGVSQVAYLGQKQTRLSLIRETANLHENLRSRRGQLLEAETRLYDLNVFDSSRARKPITDQTEEEALVKVHEAKDNEIIYGFGFEVWRRRGSPSGSVAVPGLPTIGIGNNQIAPSQSTFASPRGSIEFARGMCGGSQRRRAPLSTLLLSRLDQLAVAAYAQPHFLASQWSSLTSFSVEHTTENPLFAAGLGDLSFQVERLVSRKTNTRLQLRYDFNKTILSHLLVPELAYRRKTATYTSPHSLARLFGTPATSHSTRTMAFTRPSISGITPVALGSSASFARLFGQYAFYKPFHSIVFANSVRFSLVKAFAGSFVPTSELYFSGGGTSLRGFPINQAGPQRVVPFCNVLTGQSGCVNVTVPLGGRRLLILNSELRFPLGIMKALGGVVFYDGGNVYSAINFNNS